MDLLGGASQARGQQDYNGQTSGGQGGLVGAFEQGGLGNSVQSWIGHGPNQPVAPNPLQSALGED